MASPARRSTSGIGAGTGAGMGMGDGGAPKTPKSITASTAAKRLKQTAQQTQQQNYYAVPGQQPAPLEAVVVESKRYEEWMKLATDNKITSANAWNYALIDYFADMSLLRNGDGDNSINFQKASCTLDGCVKIWTSRVDSVATETGKLLSGLAEDGRSGANLGDDEEDDADGEDDDAKEARQLKRKAARQATTLADNFSKIKVKAFDLEFTVDPLFKKTSADFDEGGAGGILMNHLGCDGSMRVVFDAGDAKLEDDEDRADEEEEEEEHVKVDISKLRSKFLPSMELFAKMTLCPSLASFRFSPDSNLDLGILNPADEDIVMPADVPAFNAGLDEDDDMGFGGALHDNDDNDYGGGGNNEGAQDFFSDLHNGNNDDGGNDGFGAGVGDDGDDNGGLGQGRVEPFRIGNAGGERDLVMTMAANGEQMFDHFDAALMKNWAGPEHWKMRRVAVKKDDASGAAARPRKEKTTFRLDLSLPPPLSIKELFAPATTSASIRAPRKPSMLSNRSSGVLSARSRKGKGKAKQVVAVEAEVEETYTLPDDYQFSSKFLLRLFLKPKLCFGTRGRGEGGELDVNGDGELDEQFWAASGLNQAGMEGGAQDMGGMGDYDVDDDLGGTPMWNAQFMQGDDDDNDMPDFEEEGLNAPTGDAATILLQNALLGEEEDLLAGTQGQLKRVRPENVNYAKRAKRVDVKKLKDSIWGELEEVTIKVKELPTASAFTSSPSQPEAFTKVIKGLRKLYPVEKMEEISTSFCFICLLHLANEKGLRIQTPEDDNAGEYQDVDDGLRERRAVGGLDRLRIFST